jgi:hypothetical protein
VRKTALLILASLVLVGLRQHALGNNDGARFAVLG